MAGERTVRIRFTGVAKDLVRASREAENALERFDRMADNLGKTAGRVGRAVGAMIGPAVGPTLGVAAAGMASVAAAAGAAGAAVGVFGAVLGASQSEVSENATKVEDLNDKIDLYRQQAQAAAAAGKDNETYLRAQARATAELQARLALLPPATRDATMAFLQLKSDWGDFVEQNQPATFGLMTRGYTLLGKGIAQLQPLFDIGQKAADRALAAIERWADGGGIKRLVTFLSTNAEPALENLGRIASNVFSFLGNLFKQTADDGQGILEWLAEASDKLRAFGEGGGLAAFLDKINGNGPTVVSLLSSIASAAANIARAVSPLAPISLAVASALAAIIAALPPQVITTLVAAWIAYTVAMAGYNVVMGAIAVGTKIATAAQWLFNAAMTANPIGLVIAAVVALVAGIVLLYKNSETARKIIDGAWKGIAAGAQWLWNNVLKPVLTSVITQLKLVGAGAMWLWRNAIVPAWNGIVAAVQFLWNGYKRYIQLVINIIKSVATAIANVYNAGRDYFNRLVSYIGGLPGRISRAASGLFDGIKNAFRNAVNYVIDGWNRLSFSLPSINTPFGKIGGTTLNTPNIGRLASGGWAQPYATYTVNERGQELLTMGRRAGYVHSAGDTAAMMQPPTVHVYIGERELTDIVDVRVEENNRNTRRRAGAYGLGVSLA
jgi:hypothetical protein